LKRYLVFIVLFVLCGNVYAQPQTSTSWVIYVIGDSDTISSSADTLLNGSLFLKASGPATSTDWTIVDDSVSIDWSILGMSNNSDNTLIVLPAMIIEGSLGSFGDSISVSFDILAMHDKLESSADTLDTRGMDLSYLHPEIIINQLALLRSNQEDIKNKLFALMCVMVLCIIISVACVCIIY